MVPVRCSCMVLIWAAYPSGQVACGFVCSPLIHLLWYHCAIRQVTAAWAQLRSYVKERDLKWNGVQDADGHRAFLPALAIGGNRDVLLILAVSCTLCSPYFPLGSLPPLCECK